MRRKNASTADVGDQETDVESPFYNAEEAARYLRVSSRSLEHYRCDGGGPAYRKHGGTVVYHKDDLDRWSARRRFKSTSERAE